MFSEAESLLLDYKWPGQYPRAGKPCAGAGDQQEQRDPGFGCPISGVAKPAASARRDGLDLNSTARHTRKIMKDLENKVLSAAMERYGSITEVAKHFQVDRSTISEK